ncbi:aminotransferase class IV [Haliangium ochraceum]|uniref:branched-chain-amino-acid transaminase n=1 Tax=Haliangium ochraceum (strain DSM 14365 / JCM 11303 / SMP-2) TaxID=502025 RepID=D0LV28_HALO1|nr:aminotransferase class IV [Haliangium ochraceum]ACY15869.1 Branched-chain-amino-acid transaminase [Haliangium ochraceum DSM 14365]
MTAKVFIDGEISDPERAVVPVFDRGFLYGDSVYEVMRTSGGRPVDSDAHLGRLQRSAEAIALRLPPRAAIVAAIEETMAAAGNAESYVRVVVTRGSGPMGLDTALAGEPRLVVIVRPLELPAAAVYERGLKLFIVAYEHGLRRAVAPSIKTGNYLTNVMALHEARRQGADDALMCNAAGQVVEGSSCNLFVVRERRVVTPARDIGLLAGITRQRVMELARGSGIEVDEGALTPEEVLQADELFITSSIRGVVPVASVNDTPPRLPVVGPTTQQIMQLYDDYLAEQARASRA